ncbi:hypothetical protein L596_000014 [Steinernema carpocapsae]|uniref:Uncharacterized protein n=1 Tax=Steinernema carpocapsae TaxID=34508 RepID=A0A4V6I6V6_STECR|nr:hypothetical protein L596_000008 [Steinernema carpocapsae]TMS32129.1 hypothetical protein L596_000014 [Steinernema carpocapsae]
MKIGSVDEKLRELRFMSVVDYQNTNPNWRGLKPRLSLSLNVFYVQNTFLKTKQIETKRKNVLKSIGRRGDSNPRRPDPQPYPSTRGARSLGSPKLHGWTTFTSRRIILTTPIVFPSQETPKTTFTLNLDIPL